MPAEMSLLLTEVDISSAAAIFSASGIAQDSATLASVAPKFDSVENESHKEPIK